MDSPRDQDLPNTAEFDAAEDPVSVDSPWDSVLRLGLPASPSMADDLDGEESRFREACEGTIAERYEVLNELGRGGMGVVLLVRDTQLDCLRALKRPRENSARIREGFNHEGIAAASFSHPNICQVLHSGSDEYGPFLVMEFVDGETIKSVVDKGAPLKPSQAFDIARGILRGIECLHAHEPRIIHRDIKPANVLISKDGTPKLTDFGLEKIGDTRGLSITGRPIGTAAFAAPEQWIDSTQADLRSDIFSFGRTLHYALTGGYPELENEVELPEVFRSFLERCLAHDPTKRFETATQALEALAPLEERIRTISSAPSASFDSGECPQCGANNGENRRFCWDCSHPLIEECEHCQWENRSYMRYCGNCQVDLEGWKRMLAHLKDAASHVLQGEYESAESSLVAARKNSSDHEDYEALEKGVRERQAYLIAARERIDGLMELERFEEARDHLKLLLDYAPEDQVAREAVARIPDRIRVRDYHQVLGQLSEAVEQDDLEGVSYLLERATALAAAPEDQGLVLATESWNKLRRAHCQRALESIERALKDRDWADCRRALRKFQDAGAAQHALLEQRLRYQAEQALDALELDTVQDTLKRIVAIHSTGDRPWLPELQQNLRRAQQTDLDDLRFALTASQTPKELRELADDLKLARADFGESFDEELSQLSAQCSDKNRRIQLRRFATASLVTLVLGSLGALWYLTHRSQAAGTDYLAQWIIWIDEKERGGVDLGPEPQPSDPWLFALLPAFIETQFESERLVELSQELSLEHWDHLSWDQAEEYFAELSDRRSLVQANEAFRAWETRRLKAAIPTESILLNKKTPRLILLGDLRPPEINLDGRRLTGNGSDTVPYGFDAARTKSHLRERERVSLLSIEGVSGVVVRSDLTIRMDQQEPVCEVERRGPVELEAGWITMGFAIVNLTSGELIEEVRFVVSNGSEQLPARPVSEWNHQDSTFEVMVRAPADFEWTEVSWEVEDDVGNVFSGATPIQLASQIEKDMMAIGESTALTDLRALESTLLRGETSEAAAKGSGDIRALRNRLPERLMAYVPELSVSIQGRRKRPFASGVAVEATQSEAAEGDGSDANGWSTVESGDQFLVDQRDMVLAPRLSQSIRDILLIEKLDDGEWITIWEEPSAASTKVPLAAHWEAGSQRMDFRVGTPYLAPESWIPFSVIVDREPPQIVSGSIWRHTSNSFAAPTPTDAVLLSAEQLSGPQDLTLPAGEYVLELQLADDEPVDFAPTSGADSEVLQIVNGRPRCLIRSSLGENAGEQANLEVSFADLAGNTTAWKRRVRFEASLPTIEGVTLSQPDSLGSTHTLEFFSSRRPSAQSGSAAQEYPLRSIGGAPLGGGEWTKVIVRFAKAPKLATLLLGDERIDSPSLGERVQTFGFIAPTDAGLGVTLRIRIEAEDPLGFGGSAPLVYTLSFLTK